MVADLPAVKCRVCDGTVLLTDRGGTRRVARGTTRYRRCLHCGSKYRTLEIIECHLTAARNPVADRLDKAVDYAILILTNTDENGVPLGALFARVSRRVADVTEHGLRFRLGNDPRVVIGTDGRYRVKTES